MKVEIKGNPHAFIRVDGCTIEVTKNTKPEAVAAFLQQPPKKEQK